MHRDRTKGFTIRILYAASSVNLSILFFSFLVRISLPCCWIVDLSYVLSTMIKKRAAAATATATEQQFSWHEHSISFCFALTSTKLFVVRLFFTYLFPFQRLYFTFSFFLFFSFLLNTCRKNKYRQNVKTFGFHLVCVHQFTVAQFLYGLFYDLINFYIGQNKQERARSREREREKEREIVIKLNSKTTRRGIWCDRARRI